MTTVSIHMPENTGLTGFALYLRKTSDGTLVNTGGDALQEDPPDSGRFTATVAEVWTETLAVLVMAGSGLPDRDGWLAAGETIVKDSYPAVPDISSELAKVPKAGSTHRYTQVASDSNLKTADVLIGEAV